MNEVSLQLPEEEAKLLYQYVHRLPGGQDALCETYQQLQSHFFGRLTVEQLTTLLGGAP